MRVLPMIDTIWLNAVLPASSNSNWTSQISHRIVVSHLHPIAEDARLLCSPSHYTKYNSPLEAAHAHTAHDRYDMVECGAAGQSQVDLSDQIRGCSVASKCVIQMRSNVVILYYYHQL